MTKHDSVITDLIVTSAFGIEVMIDRIVKTAVSRFVDAETANILSGVSERNLCGRLALILESVAHECGLAGYFAAVEYNRKQGGKVKTIINKDYKVISINCDLILHSRGDNVESDNLIAIEMKKSNRPEKEKESDRSRLRTMTKSSYDGVWSHDGTAHPEHVCGYDLGAFIELDQHEREKRVEYFANGDSIGKIDRVPLSAMTR